MANKELKFIIEGVDNVSPKMRNVENNAEKMGKGVLKAGKLAKVGLFAVVAGATAVVTASAKMASSFEKSMANISTLVDTGAESMEDMGKQVLEISKRTPVALEDLTGALYNVRSAGIDAGDAMMVLEKSAQLGVTGLGSTEEAVDLATSAINAFNLSGEEASAVFDTIQNTVKTGKTNISELAQSFGMVAGVAKTAGVDFEELMGATSAMTTSGLKASVAQGAIRQAILALQAPTGEMSKLYKDMGVTTGEAMLKEHGLVESLRMVSDATGGSAEQMKKAFGSTEALTVALSLAGEQAETFDAIMVQMNDSSGTLDEAFKKQSQTFDAQSQILKNNLNAMMIQLGTAILPVLNKAIQAILPVIESISAWFTKVSEDGIGTSGTMRQLADTFNEYVVPIIKDAMVILKQVMKAMKWAWDNDLLGLKTSIKTTFEIVKGIFESILPIIKGVFGLVAGIMTGDFGKAQESVIGMTVDLYEIWEEKFTAIADFFSQIWDRIAGNFTMIIDGISGKFSTWAMTFSNGWSALWESAKDIFDSIWEGILKALEQNLNTAIKIMNSVIKAMNVVPGVNIPLINYVALSSEGKEQQAKKAESTLSAVNVFGGVAGARASGGSVDAGKSYLVGERGAEMFVPGRNGSMVSNKDMGGGVTINVTGNTIDSGERINQLASEIEKRLSRSMQLQRYGVTI